MFKLIPVDLATDLTAERDAHTVIMRIIFDGNINDCAVDKRSLAYSSVSKPL